MTATFDTRPPVVVQTVSGSQVQVGATTIAALGNTMATIGLTKNGYILTGIINATLTGATSGSPKAIYMGGNQIQVVNVSTVSCNVPNGVLIISGTFVFARNNLGV